jgi:hypothetical protein
VGRFYLKLVIKLMIDIAFGASEEIVDANKVSTVSEQAFAEKASSSGDQYACFNSHAPQSI